MSEKLTESDWIVTSAQSNGQPINLNSTDPIQLISIESEGFESMNFYKDGSVILPGINTNKFKGRWHLTNNDKLVIQLDTIHYNNQFDINMDDASNIFNEDSISFHSPKKKKNQDTNLKYNQIKDAFNVYADTFELIHDNHDITLKSKSVTLVCKKDRTIENLLKPLNR